MDDATLEQIYRDAKCVSHLAALRAVYEAGCASVPEPEVVEVEEPAKKAKGKK